MFGKRKQQIIYVEKLTAFSGAKIFFLSLGVHVKKIRYISINSGGERWAAVFEDVGICKDIEELVFDFSSPLTEVGALWDWTQLIVQSCAEFIIDEISEISDLIFKDLLLGVTPSRKQVALRKVIQLHTYFGIALALIAHRKFQSEDTELIPIVVNNVGDLAPVLQEALYQTQGIQIEFLGYSDAENNFLVRLLWFILEQAKLILRRVLRSENKDIKKPPTAAISSVWGVRSPIHGLSDLWWFSQSDIPGERGIILFNRSNMPATDDDIEYLESKGIRYRILRNAANKTSKYPTLGFPNQDVSTSLSDLVLALKILWLARNVKAREWLTTQSLITLVEMRRWQNLFRFENIKLIDHYEEAGTDPLSLAADTVGSARMGYHWSDLFTPDALVIYLHQIYFVWGARADAIAKSELAPISEAIVQVGNIFDDGNAQQALVNKSQEYRDELTASGAKHIVCVVDRSNSRTNHYAPERHVEFYSALFDWAERNPEIGLIVKPKHRGDLRVFKIAPELEKKMADLIACGRAKLVGGAASVLEASMTADLVVALGYNSGGVLAAMAGSRTVFWDAAVMSKGPLKDKFRSFEDGSPHVVFHDLDELIFASEGFFQAQEEYQDLGDMSYYLDRIDAFRDGESARRVGHFVRDFLEISNQNILFTDALEQTLKQYSSKWGEDKVYSEWLKKS